jgi:phosphatidate cytidylyltransferase
MESEVVREKLFFNYDLLKRVLCGFLFAPMIVLVLILSENNFRILCWLAYLVIAFEIFSLKIKGHYFLRSFALLFCFFGMKSFIYCRQFFGPMGCILLICISSFTDMGGYFFGRMFKGPKLCPKISPNKTWSGFLGGVLLANLCVFFIRDSFYPSCVSSSVFYLQFWGVELLILSAVFGDLIESLFKRRLIIKDMSKLFPGHGGLLDRLDSLLAVSMVFALIDILL